MIKIKIDPTEVRASTYAAISVYIAFLFTLIGFCTPYWLAADGKQPVKHFENLGLWEACFTSFFHPNYLYDREYRGCNWIFDEDYSFLLSFLEPPFFVLTQILFTIGFVLLLLAVIAILAIQLCFVIEKEIYAMKVLAIDMSAAAFCCTCAVIIFGIWGDDRDWMPDPEHNFLSWSFALAVVGSFFQWVTACLFWIENRILYKKHLKKQNSYAMRSDERI